ncbi:MAG: hypothetical protein IGQ45_12025 [Cyanobacterium sp. T60_A2020_053]|nr:hypothetical protein [Cyanobacterium sp. T60_A2020_053]
MIIIVLGALEGRASSNALPNFWLLTLTTMISFFFAYLITKTIQKE